MPEGAGLHTAPLTLLGSDRRALAQDPNRQLWTFVYFLYVIPREPLKRESTLQSLQRVWRHGLHPQRPCSYQGDQRVNLGTGVQERPSRGARIYAEMQVMRGMRAMSCVGGIVCGWVAGGVFALGSFFGRHVCVLCPFSICVILRKM